MLHIAYIIKFTYKHAYVKKYDLSPVLYLTFEQHTWRHKTVWYVLAFIDK